MVIIIITINVMLHFIDNNILY